MGKSREAFNAFHGDRAIEAAAAIEAATKVRTVDVLASQLKQGDRILYNGEVCEVSAAQKDATNMYVVTLTNNESFRVDSDETLPAVPLAA